MKIRILHITQALGGVESYLNQIIQYMDQERFETILMIPPEDDALSATAKKLGIEVLTVDLVREISPLKDLVSLFHILRHIRRTRPSVIHVHSSKAGVLGRLVAKLVGIPCIYTPHGYAYFGASGGLRKKFYLWVERLLRPFAAKLLAVGKSEANRSTEDVGFAPGKVTWVNNAIEPQAVASSPNPRCEDSYFVLMVGRLIYEKNPEMFVRAAGEVARNLPRVRFAIVGGGYHEFHRELVKELISFHGLEEKFRIYEWMRQDRLYQIMAKATVIVVPSRHEGLPFAPLEAMALGKPVVGTWVDGVQDVIIDGETGFLVDLNDDYAMAEKIIALLDDPGLRKRMGQAGRKRVKEHFNIRRNIQQIEKIYTDVYQEKAAGR